MAVFSTGECKERCTLNQIKPSITIVERSTTIGMKILSSTGRKYEDTIHKYHYIIQRMYEDKSTDLSR